MIYILIIIVADLNLELFSPQQSNVETNSSKHTVQRHTFFLVNLKTYIYMNSVYICPSILQRTLNFFP